LACYGIEKVCGQLRLFNHAMDSVKIVVNCMGLALIILAF